MNEHPKKDFPWTFYFNGVVMPRWGWCWPLIRPSKFIDPLKNWDWDVGPRDIYILDCRIDHVGTIESADPDIFRYAVQENLCILNEERETVMVKLREVSDVPAEADEMFNDLVEASFQMRKLVIQDRLAFWTRGYESDHLRLVEAIRRASLPHDNPDYTPPPHISSRRSELKFLWQEQAKTLHRVAASGGLTKEKRKRLIDIG